MPGDSIQVDASGAIQVDAAGHIIVAGASDPCCCNPACSNSCYVEFTSTYTDCAGWSTPAVIDKDCFSTGATPSSAWVPDGTDCLTYYTWRPATNMAGTCCSNTANCGTASASVPSTPTPTNRGGSTYSLEHGFPPDCTTTGRCVGCCPYDITILAGCATGTYRTGACGATVALTTGGNPSLAGDIGIFCGCERPAPPFFAVPEDGWWGMRLRTFDNSGGSPDCISPPCCCCNEQCEVVWCATNQSCDCTCPPTSGWVQGSPDGDLSVCIVGIPVPIVSTAC